MDISFLFSFAFHFSSFHSWKRSVCQRMLKLPKLHSFHTLAEWCWKFSNPGFNSMWIMNFQMFKLDLQKAEEPEIKLPTSIGSSKKQKNSRKTSTFASLTTPKPLTVWITTNCGKFLKRWEYQTTWPGSWDLYTGQEATVRAGHGTRDLFQVGKGVRQGCILSFCLFNLYVEFIMRNAGLESRLPGEISITSDMQMTPPLWQKVKKN